MGRAPSQTAANAAYQKVISNLTVRTSSSAEVLLWIETVDDDDGLSSLDGQVGWRRSLSEPNNYARSSLHRMGALPLSTSSAAPK